MDPTGTQWTPFLGGNPDVTPFLKGNPVPALPQERGWKDTFIMNPGEVTTVIIRWAPQDAAATGRDYFDFDPSGSGGYVWHCHIVDHEDNEMMRPTHVYASVTAPPGRLDAPIYDGYWTVHPDGVLAMDPPGSASEQLKHASVTTQAGRPLAFELAQNYPNPFKTKTGIRFDLPEESHVKLVVYDSAGRKVSTLIDQDAPAGYHTVNLDAGGLASGVYFYNLTVGNFTDTRRMMLVN